MLVENGTKCKYRTDKKSKVFQSGLLIGFTATSKATFGTLAGDRNITAVGIVADATTGDLKAIPIELIQME